MGEQVCSNFPLGMLQSLRLQRQQRHRLRAAQDLRSLLPAPMMDDCIKTTCSAVINIFTDMPLSKTRYYSAALAPGGVPLNLHCIDFFISHCTRVAAHKYRQPTAPYHP